MQMIIFYFGSARVIRSIPYGKRPRNRLDMYVPKHHWRQDNGLRPVVIYVTGMVIQILCTANALELPTSTMRKGIAKDAVW